MLRDALLYLQNTTSQDSRSPNSPFAWRPEVANKSSGDVYSLATITEALSEPKRAIRDDGTAEEEIADPALTPFLALLKADLAKRPGEAILPLSETWARRLDALAAEIGEVDPDEVIEGEVSL